MDFENLLRLGAYDHPVALVRHRHEPDWELGEGHLGITIVTKGFFVTQMRPRVDTAFVYSYNESISLKLVLEPQRGTPQHALYKQWLQDGAARLFYQYIRGVRNGHALVTPTYPPVRVNNEARLGEGGSVAMASEHPMVISVQAVGAYLWNVLEALGVRDAVDQRTIANCVLAELSKQL
jgi:hypothetical protein